jgi:hypothetical protein
MAEISGQYSGSCLVRSYIFFQLYFSSGGGAPLPAVILAGRSRRRNPCEVRSSLSQFPLRRASLPPTGQKTATRSSYADAPFVNGIRSLVTDGAASRCTRRASRLDLDPSRPLRRLRDDLYLPSAVFSSLHAFQFAGALPGGVAAHCGALFVGEGIAQAKRP